MSVSGRVIGLLGPNGAGKSTLLSLVTTARSPSAGSVHVAGLDTSDRADRKALRLGLGFVPQSMGIYPGYTVEQFLRYVCWLRRVPVHAQEEAINDSLTATDLTAVRHSKIKTLSGGTRQRTKLAQALLFEPKLTVLDEPTVGLDPEQRSDFLDLVQSLSARTPVLIATHLVEDVARVCDSVLVLRAGKVAFAGTTAALAGVDATSQVESVAVERGYRRVIRQRASEE